MKDLFFGMWSYGRGPLAARVERLSAVKTGYDCQWALKGLAGKVGGRFTVDNDDFVGGIDIQGTPVQRESDRIVIQRRVSGRVVLKKRVVVNRTEDKGTRNDRDTQFGSGFWSTSPPILGRNRYLGRVRLEIRIQNCTRNSSQAYKNILARPQ